MLLAKGQSAIERKDLKGVMSCVSKDYRDSTGLTFDALHMHALEAIRAEGHYDVLLEHTSVEVRGKTASAKARATVFLGCDHAGMQRLFSNSVTLHFKKEKSKRFLVIPTRTWKVARINGLPTDLGG